MFFVRYILSFWSIVIWRKKGTFRPLKLFMKSFVKHKKSVSDIALWLIFSVKWAWTDPKKGPIFRNLRVILINWVMEYPPINHESAVFNRTNIFKNSVISF